MANCCITDYIAEGSKEELHDLLDNMEQLRGMKFPLVVSDWGVTFLGCLIELLGGDYKKVYCRGSFHNLENYIAVDGTIRFSTDTAWVEMAETRTFLETRYPNLKFYYLSEESACDFFDSNDTQGKYWSGLDKKYF